MKFLDINLYLRKIINDTYYSCKKKASHIFKDKMDIEIEAMSLFLEQIDLLNTPNSILYQCLLSLSFIDYYRKKYLIDDTENEFFENIYDYDDLLSKIEEEPQYLESMLMTSIEILHLDIDDKGILLTVPIPNQFLKFDPFSNIEKINFFKDKKIEDLLCLYEESYVDYRKTFDEQSSNEQAIDDVIRELKIQLLGNKNNFEYLISQMIKPYYLYIKNKLKQADFNNLISKKMSKLMGNDNNFIRQFSTDDFLLKEMVTGFINYTYKFGKISKQSESEMKEK